jgi:hypothetical protein
MRAPETLWAQIDLGYHSQQRMPDVLALHSLAVAPLAHKAFTRQPMPPRCTHAFTPHLVCRIAWGKVRNTVDLVGSCVPDRPTLQRTNYLGQLS